MLYGGGPLSLINMKILVGCNTLQSLDQAIYSNHCNFWYRLGKEHSDIEFLFFTPPRLSIDTMRNMAAKYALINECEYLMFVDDDIMIPDNAFNLLLPAMENYDILAGHTVVRGYPFNNMAFDFTNEAKTHLGFMNKFEPLEDGTVPCQAIGFSLVLIKCSLLKKVKTPYFLTGSHTTEDVYFCLQAKHDFPDVRIGFHTKVPTGHLGHRPIYEWKNRDFYHKLVEGLDPELVKLSQSDDHGEEYLKKCGISI